MKAVTYRRFGSPDVLQVSDVPKPEPKPGDVLVRVHAAALNALDWHELRGKPYIARTDMGWRRPKRSILGVDMAGVVEEVGSEVTDIEPGDEVFANKARSCAEYVCGPARLFAPKPSRLTLEQAAAVPAAGMTALQAVRDQGTLRPGQTVLINGASGGVGTFAVQIAKAMGGVVTGVTSTHNVDLVRSLGADEVIDYTATDFTRGDLRYDLIVDVAANRSLVAMRRVLAPRGTMVLVGASKGDWIAPLVRLVGGSQLTRFSDQRIVGLFCKPTRADLITLSDMIEAGEVTPCIDRTYALAETAEAMRYLETMHARAKLVITI